MNEPISRGRLFVANCALLLFVAGLYVPHCVGVARSILDLPVETYIWAYRFGFVAEVLAFIFGVVGRRHFVGKVGMYGGMSLIVLEIASILWTYFCVGHI